MKYLFVDGFEYGGIGIELRNALIRSPVVNARDGMRIVFWNEHISHNSLQHLHGCPSGHVDIVSKL